MICVLDYGMGNLRSVSKAIEKLGGSVLISSSQVDLRKAEKIILPGVGAFGDGCNELKKRGVFETLKEVLLQDKPFLGICLGMQLLFEESEESPGVKGLGIFEGKVQRFQGLKKKIPHMGWNQVKFGRHKTPILRDIKDGSYFYFVHSYYPVPRDLKLVMGTCEYEDEEFAAFIGKGRVWGSQFHPEKSQDEGLKILRNFVAL